MRFIRQFADRVRAKWPTVRMRLTLVYGGLFLVSASALLALTYVLVAISRLCEVSAALRKPGSWWPTTELMSAWNVHCGQSSCDGQSHAVGENDRLYAVAQVEF